MFDREEDKVCDGGGGQRSLATSWLDNSLKKRDQLLQMVESPETIAATMAVDTGLKSSAKWRGVDLGSQPRRRRLLRHKKRPESDGV